MSQHHDMLVHSTYLHGRIAEGGYPHPVGGTAWVLRGGSDHDADPRKTLFFDEHQQGASRTRVSFE